MRDGLDQKLKRLDELPSEAKFNIVLLMTAFYFVATIVSLTGIASERSRDRLKIRHIEPVEVIDAPIKTPRPNDSIRDGKIKIKETSEF